MMALKIREYRLGLFGVTNIGNGKREEYVSPDFSTETELIEGINVLKGDLLDCLTGCGYE